MSTPNWSNRTMWTGDNLDIMRGMNSEGVDLIYLDPPFNSNKTYSAPIGSKAAGAAFKDTWTLDDVDLAWHGEIAEQNPGVYAVIDTAGVVHGAGMKSYLIMMAVRVLEMHRLLKPTGSLYLHCDPTASHYLKLLLDAVFQPTLFVNEIAWCYNVGGKSKKHWARKHDTLLFYTKSKNWHFNGSAVGIPRDTGAKSFGGKIGTDDQGRKYQDKRVKATGKYYRYYLDSPKIPEDWWVGINSIQSQATERVGYPTQKPLDLLDRIIKASSNQSDVVLDPFAGCATACVSAESLGRQWVGVDLSPLAASLVKARLKEAFKLFYEVHHRTDVPRRTDLGTLPNYRTHKHQLFGKQEGLCGGCRVAFPFRNFTVDHVIPQSKGGADHLDNLQLLCGACNSTKGTGTQAELIVKLQAQELR